MVDKGALMTIGNNHFIMKCIRDGETEKARDYVGWLLEASKGFGIKLVNPGGVENWKYGRNVHHLDDEVMGFGVTPRQILSVLGHISADLNLPHPPHIHGLRLGQPGNADITVESMAAMDGLDAHFCHVQFMSYGRGPGKSLESAATKVAQAVNETPGITVDVGQVVFGPATTMTSDGPFQFNLGRKIRGKWVNDDLESESGGGVVPLVYKRSNPVHTTMWLTGLELFLLIDDPWRVFLTTDHPNAGPFLGYPGIIRLLMDRAFRAQAFEEIHPKARKRAILPELDRTYSLYEIAIITRAGPARRLGLRNKGHLGIGADADLTVYASCEDKEEMFAHPLWVIKGGDVVVRNGQVIQERPGRTLFVSPGYDRAIEKDIRAHFEDSYTLSFENYWIAPEHMGPHEPLAC